MIKKTAVMSLIFAGVALITPTSHAGQMQPILECSKIPSDTVRLTCFDAAAKDIIKTGSVVIQSKVAAPSQEENVANFGKSQLRSSPLRNVREQEQKMGSSKLEDIILKVTKFSYTNTKKFVLFMENGQIWKQKDDGRIRLPKGEFEVRIKKGFIGGFNMTVPTKKSVIKVERIK